MAKNARTRWAAAAIALSLSGAHAQAPKAAPVQDENARQIEALGWVHGPATIKLADQAELRIAKGMRYLDLANTKRFLALNGNPPSEDNYTIAPEASSWFSILEFDPAGYVSDTEKVDPDALFKQIKAGEGADNEQRKALGQTGLHMDRWLVKPHYQPASHNLEWGTVMHTDSGGQIINYTSRLLGRDGVMKAVLVSDPVHLPEDLSQYRQAMTGFSYLPDKRYEAHTADDKMAEYGLGALVAGGAAAAAAKTGLLGGLLAMLLKFGAAFYKLIAVGAVALIAAFRAKARQLFGRRGQEQDGGAA